MSELPEILWQHTPDAVIAISPDGKVQHWNHAAENIFGYTNEEAIGKFVLDLIVPEHQREEVSRLINDALEQEVAVYECVRYRKDGSPVHVNVSTKLIHDESGNVQYLLFTKKDISHLKTLRDAKLVEARYRDLLESTPDAIVMVNLTGRIILVNSQAEKIFGYQRAELIGKEIEILLPQRYRKQHVGHRGLFFSQPRTRSMGAGLELHGLRRSGDEFPVEISLSPIETDEGTVVMSAIRDITTRMKSEKKFKDLLESAPDAMVIVNREGEIVLVNSQAVHLFGWGREEMLGQKIEMLVPERYRDRHPDHRTGFFREPRTRAMGAGLELYGVRRNGTEFPVEISLSPLETEEGLFVSSAIRDVTDRKVFEKTLQQANRMKSEFLANMSHELRTPLNGIIGFSELLVDEKCGPLNERQKEYQGHILNSGKHLLELINNVLDLSKIEAGKMELFPEQFSARRSVEEVTSVVSQLAKKKNITLTTDIQDCQVTLDLHKFKQILYNLISNAVKFTDENGKVSIGLHVDPGELIELQVIDTGIGINPEDFNKLFVEFQQLDSGTGRHYEGTGLGLALTKKIIEIQNGSITVESEAGRGSTFTVRLPQILQQNSEAGNRNIDEQTDPHH